MSECLEKAVKSLIIKQTELNKEHEAYLGKDLNLNETQKNLTKTLALLNIAQGQLKQKSKGSSNETRIRIVLYSFFMEFYLPQLVCKNMED